MIKGFGVSVKEGGVFSLTRGWAPTFIGYSIQGLGKFGLYEIFKLYYSQLLGEVSDNAIILIIGIIVITGDKLQMENNHLFSCLSQC